MLSSGGMMLEFEGIVQKLEQWSSGKAVIVHGHGGDFCAGADLDFVRKILSTEEGQRMSSYLQGAMTRFKNLPLISVAVIGGIAVGGGAELSTACDFRLMTPNAKIGFVQLRMGVVTGFGGGTRLTQMLGRTQALRILCSGKVLKAEECREIGLADHILSGTEDCVEESKAWIQDNFPHDNTLTQKVKEIVLGALSLDTQSALSNEQDIFTTTWCSPLHHEALSNNIKHK